MTKQFSDFRREVSTVSGNTTFIQSFIDDEVGLSSFIDDVNTCLDNPLDEHDMEEPRIGGSVDVRVFYNEDGQVVDLDIYDPCHWLHCTKNMYTNAAGWTSWFCEGINVMEEDK